MKPTTWLTSDQHFYHANVIKYCNRPYKDVDEMNQALIDNWNSVVDVEDTVIVLGDFSLSTKAIEKISHRLSGKRAISFGNHDAGHPYNSYQRKAVKQGDPDRWKRVYEENGWEILPLIYDLGTAIASHIPYDCNDPRYTEWIPKDEGRVLLCGHVHEKWKTKTTDKGTLMINVGVDVNDYKPVSAREIANLYIRSFEG